MGFPISRPLLILAVLLPASVHGQEPLAGTTLAPPAPAATQAREPLGAREADGGAGPWILTPKQHIAMDAFFGGSLGSMGGGLVGLLAAEVTCPAGDRGLFSCERPTVLPEIGFSLGVGPGAYSGARGAAVIQGCDPADARRRAGRGALRGLVVGLAPLLAFHLAGGREERVEWTLALAGSGYQVASVTHATWGCLDAITR
ncbi:MAG: hypothetical protein KY467_00160 [Gemmatimonadetes bacterium]|nr:hypothetical protein [Gemmatimonadota bacterium]